MTDASADAEQLLDLAYSPLSFLRDRSGELAEHERQRMRALASDPAVIEFGSAARCLVRRLEWDSEHFGMPVYRIERMASAARASGIVALAATLRSAAAELTSMRERSYVFTEVPAEDVVAVQGLGQTGFRLVETRVTYYLTDLAGFQAPRHAVRDATPDDEDDLRRIASTSRNPYDRYHADPSFSQAEADAYLGTYAAATLRGFSDVVLVPDVGGSPGAFFALRLTRPPRCPVGLNHHGPCTLEVGVGRIALVAVGPARRGWHHKLMAEATHRMRDSGIDVAVMTTQATNRAVIHNSELLGYRLGRTTHVFAAPLAD